VKNIPDGRNGIFYGSWSTTKPYFVDLKKNKNMKTTTTTFHEYAR
jgi:hypothetical protein